MNNAPNKIPYSWGFYTNSKDKSFNRYIKSGIILNKS